MKPNLFQEQCSLLAAVLAVPKDCHFGRTVGNLVRLDFREREPRRNCEGGPDASV
jgi:hypothetical protein